MNQRRRASLLIGELARFFRGILWQTAGLAPPALIPPTAGPWRSWRIASSPRTCWSPLTAASRRIIIWRRVYLPMILSSLIHDLGKVVNRR